jgi:ATP-dependent protease ClpP protease subunit
MKSLKLLNFFAKNAKKGSFYAEANVIYVYDVIVGSDAEAEFWGGVSPQAFVKTLKGMTGPVEMRINSPGGDVFGARAMAAAMREYGDTITAYVDGYAASAASLIAVAASKVVMAEGSMMMIHKAWTFAMGNADDLAATADLLEKIDATIADTYAAKSGGDADDFAAKMAAETWFTAAEAVAVGLADEVAEAVKAKAKNAWDMSVFDHAPPAPEPDPAPEPNPEPETQSDHGHRARAHALRMLERAA